MFMAQTTGDTRLHPIFFRSFIQKDVQKPRCVPAPALNAEGTPSGERGSKRPQQRRGETAHKEARNSVK